MTPFRTDHLDNGIAVAFFDLSNRYFGDYHRVRIEVRLHVPRPGREEPLIKVHSLERMGVAGAEVGATRDSLAEDYLRNTGRYLGHSDYPARLIAATTAPRRRTFPAGCRSDVP